MHGGADGSGAPTGSKNGNYKRGRYTEEVAATRRWLREVTHLLDKFRSSEWLIIDRATRKSEQCRTKLRAEGERAPIR
jgi:hypothetical protein